MADTSYCVLAIDDVPDHLVVDGTLRWKPLRHTLDVRAFGVNAYVADAGQDVIEDHDETGNDHEELYLVVRGRATFTLDGSERDVPAASLVYLPDPATQRKAVAKQDGTLVLAVGGPRGGFVPSEWEERFIAESGGR